MAQRDDILVEPARAGASEPTLRMKLAAFVPLTIALIGVGAVMFGGVSARQQSTASVPPAIDSMSTGSISGR